MRIPDSTRRSLDSRLSEHARDVWADLAGATILLGVYFDARGSANSAGGVSPAAAAYRRLLLSPAMSRYFDTRSQMPGRSFEPRFITDPLEGSIATSPAGQPALAAGRA